MAAYKKFSYEESYPSNVVMKFKTVILLENFSFGLNNFVNLSTTFLFNFFNVFYFFHKNAFFNDFLFLGSTFLYIYELKKESADV